jgi:potassium efflux system protein
MRGPLQEADRIGMSRVSLDQMSDGRQSFPLEPRGWFPVWCWQAFVAAVLLSLFGAMGAAAETAGEAAPPPPTLAAQVASLKGDIGTLAEDVEAHAKNFKSLLEARTRADTLIQRGRMLVRETDDVFNLERHRVELSAETAGKMPAKDDSVAATALLRRVEALRERITDLRRRQLNGRIYAASYSPFAPAFWSDLVNLSVSTTLDQIAELEHLWEEHAQADLLADTLVMAIVVAVLVAVVTLLRRTIAARLMPARREETLSRRALMLRALVSLFLSALLVPLALAVLMMVDRQIDFAPDELDPFFVACTLVWAGTSLGTTVLRIALQPDDSRIRLVPMGDYQARILYRCGLVLMLVYGTAIALDELQGALHILVAISAATTMIWVAICALCMGWCLVAMRHYDEWTVAGTAAARDPMDLADLEDFGAPATGTSLVAVTPTLHRRFFLALEICGWIIVITTTASMLTGYLALAGFVMGRFIVTILFWTLAYIFLKSIDVLLTPETARGTDSTPLLSRLLTPDSATADLMAVVAAGLLRVAIIVPIVFVTLGPWHLEYGEVNPFQDTFAGLNLADLRDAVGSVGFAAICLLLGLGGTTILTSWLDGSLLPYTKLDAGVRYSLTTIIGYGGITLSIILALSQLGISPQSLTVIASALSVGIGFGLQSIVSNFVSGLIVLTERRVRVGDVVNVKGEEGRVRKINVRSTLISAGDADLIVPNTDLITSIVRNKTLSDPRARLRLPLVIRQDADLQTLFDIVLGVTYHHSNVASDPQPTMVMTKPSPIGLEFEIVCMLVDETQGSLTRSELYLQWIDHFRSHGIFLAQDPTPVTS